MTRRGRSGVVALALAVVTGFAAGCADADELDAEKLARDVPAAVLADHPELVTDVVCPEPIEREAGVRTACFASIAGTAVELTVSQLDDDGAVRVELGRPLLDVDLLSARIAERLTADVGVPTSVTCEGPPVRVLQVGDEIRCDATDDDNRTRTFVATILDESAAYELRLE
ncbi:MAG TPA: DUF4333 domain-containing protein [Acidimicrobiales bacterium]